VNNREPSGEQLPSEVYATPPRSPPSSPSSVTGLATITSFLDPHHQMCARPPRTAHLINGGRSESGGEEGTRKKAVEGPSQGGPRVAAHLVDADPVWAGGREGEGREIKLDEEMEILAIVVGERKGEGRKKERRGGRRGERGTGHQTIVVGI